MYIPNDLPSFDKYDEPRLHMERLMRIRLIEFDLSPRIVYPLDDVGIRTLGDLTHLTRDSLKRIRNIGESAIRTIEDFLANLDLHLS